MKHFHIPPSLYASLLTAIFHSPIYAEIPDQPLTVADLLDLPLEELMQIKIVSEATGSKQPISKAPAIVKIITAEDIKKMGATDLDEVLETVPELHVTRSGFLYDPLYLIRGIYTDFNPEVLLLVNNVPFQSLQRSDRTSIWAGMPVNAIARIEVLRGSGAAIHADAFAGAINIVTKTQEDIHGTETGGRLGSFNTKHAWVLHGGQYGGLEVATALEYKDTDGQRELLEEDNQTSLDKLFGSHLSLAPGHVNIGHRSYEARLDLAQGAWRWRTGWQERDKVGAGAGFTSVLDPVTLYHRQTINTDLTYHNPHLTEHWEVSGQVSYLYNHRKSDPVERFFLPGAFGGMSPDGMVQEVSFKEDALRFNLSAFYTGFSQHTWLLETGYTDAALFEVIAKRNFDLFTHRPLNQMVDFSDTPEAVIPEKSRQSWRLFLQDTWQLAPTWELTSTLRYYDYSDFGQTLNPRLGLVWQTRPYLVTKLLYGQAFRPPSLAELFGKAPMVENNPALKPETIHTLELAVSYQPLERLLLDLDVFTYQAKDAILFVPWSADKTQPQNVGSKDGHGFGIEAQWQLNDSLTLLGNYSFQTATDQDGHQIPNAPRHKFYFRTDWQFLPHWNVDGQANWVGKRSRRADDPRVPIDNYTTVDLTLRYQTEKQPWELGLSVRNVFDAEAREPADSAIPNDLPLAGRNVWGEVRYRF